MENRITIHTALCSLRCILFADLSGLLFFTAKNKKILAKFAEKAAISF